MIFRSSRPAREDRAAGPGYQVLAPFALTDGGVVLVNRGFAPLAWKDQPALRTPPPAGDIEIAGLMRPPEERNFFTPADEPDRGIWFSRDPASMAAKLKLTGRRAVHARRGRRARRKGLAARRRDGAEHPNNHLSYALTWFGLAATLAGVFGVWAWGRRRRRVYGIICQSELYYSAMEVPMPTRNVVLTERQDNLIDTLVRSGRYQNASEVMREGLRMIENREAEDAAKLEALRNAAQIGLDGLARGEFREFARASELAAHLETVAAAALAGSADK